jgi:hypothetical protein
MKSKVIISLLGLILFTCKSNAQQKHLPSTEDLGKSLRSFMEAQKELDTEDQAVIYVINLLDYQEYKQGIGICKFGVLGSHHLPFLVLISEKDVKIVRDYKVTSILEVVKTFMSEHKEYTEVEKSLLLKNVADVLYSRMKMIEDSSINEEIEIKN